MNIFDIHNYLILILYFSFQLKSTAKQMKNVKGFTLVEVISVLAILGILAAIAVPKFFDMQEKARIKALNGCITKRRSKSSFWQQYIAKRLQRKI